MKSIVANIVRGRTLSYLLAAGLAFAAAQSAQAKVNANAYWNGKGKGSDAKWSTSGNWLNNNGPWDCNYGKILFKTTTENNSIGSYTALLDSLVSIEKSLWIEDGSSLSQPYVFEASDSSCGLTLTGNGGGSEYQGNAYVGYDGDGYLHIKAGTYSFNRLALGNGGATSRVGWLKIGDGSSSVSIAATGGQPEVSGASKLIADKATLNFTGQKFYMRQSGGAYITNSTMTAKQILLEGSSSMTASGSTITATGDHSSFKETSQFIADNSTLVFTGKNFNMYGTSSANIQDSTTTAALLNMAVNENNDCKAVFNGGSLTLSSTSLIGYGKTSKGYMYATNLTFTITGGSSHLSLGGQDTNRTGATGVVDKKDGDWTIGGDLVIGAQGSSTGTFTTDGGSVTVGGDTYIAKGSGSTGTLTIKNGTFNTKSISATGTATLNIDGGTLKAGANNVNLINSDIAVKVGANGATIDTASCAVTIASAVDNADGATGAITFTGGGKVTLSGAANWTGTTTVNAGTVLAFPAAKKSTLVTRGIMVAIPEAGAGDGTTVLEINDGNGTFSAEDIAAMALTGNDNDCYALILADGGAKVAISNTLNGEYVWNGGSSGDGWRTDGNWSKNNVAGDWYDSTAAAFENAGDSATVDAAVTAASVTFRANATVGGTAVLTAPVVAVSNEVSATVNAPTAGALEKTGPGTLTLGASRNDVTTLSEGTLVMSGSTSINWPSLVFGSDAEKPVTLKLDANATLASIPSPWLIGSTAGIANTIVKEGGDWTVPGEFRLGAAAGNVAAFEHNGGTMAVNGYLWVGYGDGTGTSIGAGTGTLTINGGTVEVAGEGKFTSIKDNCMGTINLNAGGTLKTKYVHWNSNASYTLVFNGGTLFALAKTGSDLTGWLKDKGLIHANVCVRVDALGGTINANNLDNVIAAPIGGTGGMAFKGGGKVTLASGNTYTGGTTVELGTTVHVAASGDISGTVNASVPDVAPVAGAYALVTIDGAGTFTDAVLTGVVAPANCALRLSVDAKSVLCVYGNTVNAWVGGATGSLSVGTNWSRGVVPQSGDSCVIGNVAAATLTVGDTFAPSSITFPADTALITINAAGEEAISGLATVVNNSSQHHVFNCKVVCASGTPTLPMLASNYVSFTGGIEMTALSAFDNMLFYGNWHVKGNWDTNQKTATVKNGSSLVVDGLLNNPYGLTVESGATLTAADAEVHNADKYFLKQNSGTFTVTNEMRLVMESGSTTKYHLGGLFNKGNANAVTRVHGLVNSASTYQNAYFPLNNTGDSAVNRIVMGGGGLSFRDCHRTRTDCYPYFVIEKYKSVILESSADWSFGANPVSDKDLCLELVGSVTVDTSDYDDRTIGHTIRAIGRIGNAGKVTVTGCGKLSFEYESDFSGGLDVKDTATVSMNAGCRPGSGAVSIARGAKLEVAQSGSVSLGGNLTLADGATLAFNFTNRTTAPTLAIASGKTVTAHGKVKVKVSAAGGIRPKGRTYTLTSGGGFNAEGVTVSLDETDKPEWAKKVESNNDGNIVLTVKPAALALHIK